MSLQRNSPVACSLALSCLLLAFTSAPGLAHEAKDEKQSLSSDNLVNLSIEDLMNVEIQSSSSLTQTTRKLQPSTVTTITREQIKASGARSLDELLDIYVPNLQLLDTQYRYRTIGLRGISSLTSDKLLILVNGKELNEHTDYGAMSERDLPMLTDIHHIDVVRGPGSALYGVGALAMVVNIITETAETFQGSQVTLRTGQIEEFYSSEYKWGQKFKDGSGLYTYAGVAQNLGSEGSFSPMDSVYPRTWGYVRDQEGYRDMAKYKLYADYVNGPFEAWARYTRGGTRYDKPMHWVSADPPQPDYHEMGYQQAILSSKYTFKLSDEFTVEASSSYDMFQSEMMYGSGPCESREDKLLAKAVAKWNPNDRHSLAFGVSELREMFGLRATGYTGEETQDDQYNPGCMSMIMVGMVPMPRWTTDTLSFFGEHQWKINNQWTNFLGMRIDKNTFTDYLWSPRDTIIYTPTDRDTIKFMFSRSVRLNFASEMYVKMHPTAIWVYNAGSDSWNPLPVPPAEKTKPEVLYAYEVRYERQQTEDLLLASSLFFNDQAIKGYTWEPGAQAGTSVGRMQTYGLELEGTYRKGQNEISLSHSYTKMYRFDPQLSVDGSHYLDQMFTSEPYGYGQDLAYWSNHQTKLVARRQMDEKMSLDSSVRILWGYPGAKAYNEWRAANGWAPKADHSIFSGNVLLNLGLAYKASKTLDLRLDGYNLLGLFDQDLNQRLIGFNHNNASARSSAPALGLSASLVF